MEPGYYVDSRTILVWFLYFSLFLQSKRRETEGDGICWNEANFPKKGSYTEEELRAHPCWKDLWYLLGGLILVGFLSFFRYCYYTWVDTYYREYQCNVGIFGGGLNWTVLLAKKAHIYNNPFLWPGFAFFTFSIIYLASVLVLAPNFVYSTSTTGLILRLVRFGYLKCFGSSLCLCRKTGREGYMILVNVECWISSSSISVWKNGSFIHNF